MVSPVPGHWEHLQGEDGEGCGELKTSTAVALLGHGLMVPATLPWGSVPLAGLGEELGGYSRACKDC